jgi:enoyl-CoA hydratase
LIGTAKAKEMLFTGDTVNAAEAYRVGLVNKVVPKEKLLEEASTGEKSCIEAESALALIKKGVATALNGPFRSITMEMNCFSIAFTSEDGREGINAFVEKRKPVYKGK